VPGGIEELFGFGFFDGHGVSPWEGLGVKNQTLPQETLSVRSACLRVQADLIERGYTYARIAEELGLHPSTVAEGIRNGRSRRVCAFVNELLGRKAAPVGRK